MDQLERNYMDLLQMFKEIELPDDPGMLDCCIWWIYQLNKVTDEKESRNFMLKKMINDLHNGFLSRMFWKKQKINFGPTDVEICEQRRDCGDVNLIEHVDLLTIIIQLIIDSIIVKTFSNRMNLYTQ